MVKVDIRGENHLNSGRFLDDKPEVVQVEMLVDQRLWPEVKRYLSTFDATDPGLIVDMVKELAPVLPGYNASRMPYTYHHDYIRINVDKFSGWSRSEIADHFRDICDDELYAVALLFLVQNCFADEILNLPNYVLDKIRVVIHYAQRHLRKMEH